MNCGGDYYYFIFFKDDKIIYKGQHLVYRGVDDTDAEEIAKYNKFHYDRWEADFIREQSGDEI